MVSRGPLQYMSQQDDASGLYYAGRRVFLSTEGGDNPLQPPADFMTRKQMRNHLRVTRSGSGLEGLRTLDVFVKDAETMESKKEKKRKEQDLRQKNKPSGTIVLQRFSSTNKDDWVEELHAGCRMWINHNTGEVSDECPFNTEEDTTSADEGIATGAAVYDPSLMNEVFTIIDGVKK